MQLLDGEMLRGDGERHTEKLSDYSAYYRALKARYEALLLRSLIDSDRLRWRRPNRAGQSPCARRACV